MTNPDESRKHKHFMPIFCEIMVLVQFEPIHWCIGLPRAIVIQQETISGGTVHSVSTVVVHDGYNQPPRDNDIAVLVLARRSAVSADVAAVSLPMPNAVVPDNATLVHVGWGQTNVRMELFSSHLRIFSRSHFDSFSSSLDTIDVKRTYIYFHTT